MSTPNALRAAQELNAVSDRWTDQEMADVIDRETRLPELIDALQFYANPENWKEHETGVGTYPGDAVDYGARAREAIAKTA